MKLTTRIKRLEGITGKRRKVCSRCGPADKFTYMVPAPRCIGDPYVPVERPGITPEGLCVECGMTRVFKVMTHGPVRFDDVE